jgi:hypothetical protein
LSIKDNLSPASLESTGIAEVSIIVRQDEQD